VTHWSRDYVGLPWKFAGRSSEGVDCWGLLWLVYREVLGIPIASYAPERPTRLSESRSHP
jgi:cell wall-associated NlpC family hydrolase